MDDILFRIPRKEGSIFLGFQRISLLLKMACGIKLKKLTTGRTKPTSIKDAKDV